MHESLWITLKQSFSKVNIFSLGFGLGILVYTSGQLVKKKLTSLQTDKIVFAKFQVYSKMLYKNS